MLVLFLNELSVDDGVLSEIVARKRVLELLRLLRQIRKKQPQLALNSQQTLRETLVDARYSLSELLSGNDYKEEWRFLRGFENRSPFDAEMGDALTLEVQGIEYHYGNQISIAAGWAALLDTGIVSFVSDDWKSATVDLVKTELDEQAELQDSNVTVRQFSFDDHISNHQQWLVDFMASHPPSAGQLWQQRDILFPYLRFLDRAECDLIRLEKTGAPYRQVFSRLVAMNKDIERWVREGVDDGEPSFSHRTAAGEHDNRREYTKLLDNGADHYFAKHQYFRGVIEGRLHFRVCTQEQKAIIAYFGQKLDASIGS